MRADVEGAHVDYLIGFVERFRARIFFLQVGLLRGRQPLRVALEPDINRRFVLLDLYQPPLVEQRHDGAIRHRLIDGISMNDPAEAHHVALLAFEQWRAGKADVAGVGEHLPHPRSEHAQLRALRFIYQHKYLGGFILKFARGQRLVEFIDQRGNDVCFVFGDQFHQVPPRLSAIRCQAASREGVAELLIEINAVGHEHDARRADIEIQHQRLGEHHHRQRLA